MAIPREATTAVMVDIELEFMKKVLKILIDQKDNCNELLAIHDQSLGRTTKKNTHIAEMYEGELGDIDYAVSYLNARLF